MATEYTIIFVNNSSNTATATVYQEDPTAVPGQYPLAWKASLASPSNQVQFTWQVEFDFVWGQTGVLAPGEIFQAAQVLSADLSTSNKVTLVSDGAPTFTDQTQGPEAGKLFIDQASSVPIDEISVGVGMAGDGTFVVQAQPNSQFIYEPQISYWIVFGTFEQGEVLDTSLFGAKAKSLIGSTVNVGSIQIFGQPTEIEFPVNVYSMTATLNQDNTWTITPTDP